MKTPSPEEFANRVFAAFGGQDRLFAIMEARLEYFNGVWSQDAERIGRVLRAHLSVEHFLTEYLQFISPKLGVIDGARLSFSQKIELLSDNDPLASPLKPGLRRLNSIRNRIAHKLKVEVQQEDKAALLNIPIFRAMSTERAKHLGPSPEDPLSVLEQFAKFAAGLLHSGADPNGELWKNAFSASSAAVQQGVEGPMSPPSAEPGP